MAPKRRAKKVSNQFVLTVIERYLPVFLYDYNNECIIFLSSENWPINSLTRPNISLSETETSILITFDNQFIVYEPLQQVSPLSIFRCRVSNFLSSETLRKTYEMFTYASSEPEHYDFRYITISSSSYCRTKSNV